MESGRRTGAVVALTAALALGAPVPGVSAQSVLERTPNVEGIWATRPWRVHFHFLHRFMVTDPPTRKLLNSPTLLLGVGLPGGVFAGGRYASSSLVVAGEPNEWELFARWTALPPEAAGPLDLAVQGGWNTTASSADGEVVAGATAGPVRLLAGARAFSAFAGGDGRAAWLAGARLRLVRHVGLAADAAQVLGSDAPDLAWSAGLQLEIPYTPHSLSLHLTNANTTTLQGATIGAPDRRWGFEFTIPFTLSRYFGSGEPASAGPRTAAAPASASVGDAVAAVVEMDNRLRFLPDTLRVRTGETVLWRNTSDVVHTVTGDPGRAVRAENVRLPQGAAPFHSGDMVPGAEYSHRFDVAGTYTYTCVPHELAGMVGTVIVEE